MKICSGTDIYEDNLFKWVLYHMREECEETSLVCSPTEPITLLIGCSYFTFMQQKTTGEFKELLDSTVAVPRKQHAST